jgi:2-amino-3-ketobutyrate coenzyme A ligase (EC 2.3.1.29)
MIGDAALAKQFADKLLAQGIYVIGFFYPVVPQGKAEFAHKFQRHTPQSNWIKPSMLLLLSAKNLILFN